MESHAAQSSALQRIVRSPYAMLAVLALLCHGTLLLCDYKIWDGWLIQDWQRAGRYDDMWRQYSEAGIKHHYLIHRTFGFLGGNPWLYKLVSLSAYLGCAWSFYYATKNSGLLSRRCALIAASFALTCPGLMTFGEAALLPYLLGQCAWFVAASFAIRAEYSSGGAHVVWRVLAVATFFLGLTYYAMVVYYLAFYLLYIWFLRRKHEVESLREWVVCIAKRAEFLLVPPIFWLLRGKLMPTHGFYAGYNTPKLDLKNFAEAYGSLFTKYLPGHFAELQVNPIVLLSVIAVGVLIARRWTLWQPAGWRELAMLCGAGVFLIVLGCFPYACVKRTFDASTYSSNASQLIPIGGAFLLTAVVGAVRLIFRRDRNGVAAMVLFVYLLVSFAGIWSMNALHWQALAAKEHSIARKLQQDAIAQKSSIFFIVDRFPIPRTDSYPVAVRCVQLQAALGDRTRFGKDTPWISAGMVPRAAPPEWVQQELVETTLPYYFSDVNTHGRQALLFIRPGPRSPTPEKIAWQYLGFRFFWGRGAGYIAFLDGLTELMVIPLR